METMQRLSASIGHGDQVSQVLNDTKYMSLPIETASWVPYARGCMGRVWKEKKRKDRRVRDYYTTQALTESRGEAHDER